MRVFKRTVGGKLTANYYVKMRVNGRQVLKSTGCSDKRAAEAWVREHVEPLKAMQSARELTERVRLLRSGGESVAVGDGGQRYLAKPLRRAPGAKRTKQILAVWGEFSRFAVGRGETTLDAVTVETGEAWAAELRGAERGLSGKSANDYVSICKAVFRALERDAGIVENPFAGVRPVAGRGRRRHAFNAVEVAAILEACDDFMRPLVVTAVSTGMRQGDCCRLRWDEVDLAGGWVTRVMGKTGRVARCPILPALNCMLQEHAPCCVQNMHLFPDQARMHECNPDGVSYRFKKVLKRAGVLPVDDDGLIRDFHSLRHSFVWNAAEAGVPLPVVQAMVGHVTPAMTKLYADHATDRAMLDAAGRLGGDPANPLARFTTAELKAELSRRGETQSQ